jgi:hypothetical protein
MRTSENLDAIEGGGCGGVFIASNHFLVVGCFCCRWAHRTVRWCTRQGIVHCLVHAISAHRWGLEWLTIGVLCPVVAPDSPVPYRTCPVRSDFTAWHLTLHCTLLLSTVDARLPLLRWLTGHVRCTPYSPVNYRGTRPGKTREWLVRVELGLGHRTLSGAPLATHSQVLCSKFCWVPNFFSFLVCVEPYAPEIKDILAN